MTFALAHFSDTITLGSVIIAALAAMAGLVTYGYGLRWKTAFEVSEATVKSLMEGREAFRVRAERLEGELANLREQVRTLEGSRSLEPVLRNVAHGFEQVEHRFAEHERRAQERHEINQRQGQAHLQILERIGDTLAELGVKDGER